MGIYDRQYYRDGQRIGFSWPTSMVLTLIAINGAVFLANILLSSRNQPNWLTFNVLALESGDLLRPWFWYRLISYGFAHSPNTIQHVLFNMLGLFFLGRAVEQRMGSREFLWFYLTAVLLGGLLWAARMQTMPQPGAQFLFGAWALSPPW